MKILLKYGDLYLPKHFGIGDILIENGIILKIDKDITEKADEVLNCKNKIICPMFVDGHEHLLGNYWREEEIINSGVGTIVACLAGENNPEYIKKLIQITKNLNQKTFN